MAIAESGGPTTQAGISYQNGIAALYLGRMLDPRQVVDSKKVVEVRAEAPEEVDDIVVTFANGGKLYIQAKESVSKANDRTSVWGKVWRDFEEQFNRAPFISGRDKLQLWSGLHKDEIVESKDLSERASTSNSYEEWQGRLTKNLSSFLEHLKGFLSPDLIGDKEKLLSFFASVEVVIAPRQFVEEEMMLYRMPESNQAPSALFSLLRDLVGGEARVRGTHTIENIQEWLQEKQIEITAAVSIERLRSAVYSSSSIMRHQTNTLGKTGKRLSRSTSKDISKWLLETTDMEPIGVLLDQAGTGKTVVIQEILEELERQGVDVLAIKADQQIVDVHSLDDLQTILDLPIRLERVAGVLAPQSHFIVLIDQIDALSLSMAHDQRALNLALDLISRLRSISCVRVLISCRQFDFNSDPRLKNLEGCKVFHLEEFSEGEIEKFLDGVGVDYNLLLPSTQKLLRIPLHLNLFLMAHESEESKAALQDRGFTSLQELYHLVWEKVVMRQHPDAPPAWEREQALILMAQYMDGKQKITVPKSFFTKRETSSLERALQWLSSEGIVSSQGNELGFFHQTFFDYCYARDFVDKGSSLVETLLATTQGLFQRPQMVQVLSYLRGLDDQRGYVQQLNALLRTENLRYHLKNHLYRWIASLPSLMKHEWRLVKSMTEERAVCFQLLQFSNGNPGWFEFWKENAISDLLDGEDEEGYEEVFRYLMSIIDFRQREVIEFIRPYYKKDQRMEQIVGNFILRIRIWKCREAVEMLEIVTRKISHEYRFFYIEWEGLARYDPEALCRILRYFMDQALENYKRKKQERDNIQSEVYRFSFISLKEELNKIRSTKLKEALNFVVGKSSLYFLETFIPWLVAAVQAKGDEYIETSERFIPDYFFDSWYERAQRDFYKVMNDSWLRVFVTVAHEQPQAFLKKVAYLSNFPYESIQFLVARVLREVPELYATTSLEFLLNDPRRLGIGRNYDYDSRQLIKSIFPYIQEVERRKLEDFILHCVPLIKGLKLDGYRYRDRCQFGLLQAIGYENLSNIGKGRFLQLGRKFPGYKATDNPRLIIEGEHGSPINFDSASRMSDRQWLKAMKKYQGGIEHPNWFKGGSNELSWVLQKLVIKHPKRFFDLIIKCEDDQLDQHYVCALLKGLAESEASSELLFMAIERFKNIEEWDIRRTIASAVEKRANEQVPDPIIKLLYRYLDDSFIMEPAYEEEPFSGYLNTVRGLAMNALMRVFSQDEKKHIYERWTILCYAVQNENISLRAGAIHELIYMIRHDRQRAFDLFDRAIEGTPQLYKMPYTYDFCYWAMGNPFERLIPHLVRLMNDEKEEVQQRGAELVAIASISKELFENKDVQKEMESLVETALEGSTSQRRGIARIFSGNLLKNPSPILINGLNQLINDTDEEVQSQVGYFLYDINKHHGLSQDVRAFVLDFAESKSVVHSGYELGQVLWEHGVGHPEWTLSVIQRLVKNDHIRNSTSGDTIDSTDLIRVVMNIYTDPLSNEDLQSQAMDTFDRLMELYSVQAQGLLAEWDRR